MWPIFGEACNFFLNIHSVVKRDIMYELCSYDFRHMLSGQQSSKVGYIEMFFFQLC